MHHQQLVVWQRAIRLALAVYDHTRAMPYAERFGLTSHMRRAAVSISSNIAEGAGRSTNADFARFLSMAAGSASELSSLAEVSEQLGYLDDSSASHVRGETARLRKMLKALAASHRRTL